MSADLRLDSTSSATVPALKAALPVDAGTHDAPSAPSSAAIAASSAKPDADLPNPRLHTDLALNRLVLEFFNAQGTLTNSIPSQKQLDAYRLAAFSGNPKIQEIGS
jgi:hypothetical protein